jgi:hypothetical protein
MAKTATARKLEEPAEPATHEITTLQEADLALDRLGELSDQVGIYEARGRRAIRKVETWLNEKTAADMAEGAAIVVALEAFATRKRAELLPGDKKSLTLRFGSIGFRFTPWRPPEIFPNGGSDELDREISKKLSFLLRIPRSKKRRRGARSRSLQAKAA